MTTASPAVVRTGHAFDGGGGRSKVIDRKVNWTMTTNGDSDEDEKALSIARSTKKVDVGNIASAGSSTSGRNRGEGVASGRKDTGSGGSAEKKRGLGESAKVIGAGGGSVTKKVKVSADGAMDSRKGPPVSDDDDEDDLPLSTRMNNTKSPGADMTSKIAAAKMAWEEKKKFKDGLAGMANKTSNGAAPAPKASAPRPAIKEGDAVIPRPAIKDGEGNVPRSSTKEGQGRVPNHSVAVKDEKPAERKSSLKLTGRAGGGNSVVDDDSDDDKPLSSRKSLSVNATRDTKPVSKEEKESVLKKRPAGQNVPSSSPPAAKKSKMLSSIPQSQRPSSGSLQSPKSGSSQSAKSPKPSIKRETDSAPIPAGGRRADLDDSDDDLPLSQRISTFSNVVKSMTVKKSVSPATQERDRDDDDEDDDLVPLAKRMPSASVPKPKVVATIKKPVVGGSGSAKSITKKVLEQRRKGKATATSVKITKKVVVKKKVGKNDSKMPVSGGSRKWDTLEHSGVIFPPPYQPHGVKMNYKGKPVTLTPDQEEVATMFAVMKDTDYASKPKFVENFWGDWQPILGPKHVIQDFERCDFTPIYDWHQGEKEKKKTLTSEEKKRLREEKLKAEDKYMWALVNGVKEKVGNFRVEPPGLFRGRGEHPKMGKLKKRILPENIVINIGKGAPIPECPMPGHKWKEIRHDDTVTWLAYWNDPINIKEFKYVFLAASSSLKGQSDMEKYEKARLLKDHIENIRKTYTRNFNSADPGARQIAVATYLIDRLALRAGNEKDEDEADTVGCCSLKVEHVILVPPKSLTFDFLGKDSIRYFNTVVVEEKVYKAIGDFKKGKTAGNDLFDRLDTSKLNAHLKGIMPALTAKVFRTYNASVTLDKLLQDTVGSSALEKSADYQRANKEVAILCNHQRTVSKSHSTQMEKLEAKMAEAEDLIEEMKVDLDRVRKGKPPLKDSEGKQKKNQSQETLEKKIAQAEQRVEKMRLEMRIKDDLKTVALGTSKINYLDPRITVAWCKMHEVPIEKIFNKSLLAKFSWAMDVEPEYRF